MGNKKKILTRKVYSRVTPETYRRLDEIKGKYGFSSVYEILQGLIHCFLRVADPDSDQQSEPVAYDIEQMFDELSSAEKHVEFIKPKRKEPYKSVNDEQKPNIHTPDKF